MEKLRQLFKNNSNCYASSEEVVLAMDEDKFVQVVSVLEQRNANLVESLKNLTEIVEKNKNGYTKSSKKIQDLFLADAHKILNQTK